MKKILYIFLAILLGLVSCTEMPFTPEPVKADETGLVSVIMQLQVPVPLQAFTKANDRAEEPHIDYIKVAVFGTSGYPQAYSLAEPVNADGNPISSYAIANGDTCYFKVLLPVYEGEAHVHIIANGDESIPFVDQTEASIMEKMYTTGNVGAYWASFIMPEGILPQKDNNGIMETYQDGNFKPSAETQAFFEDLVLVRNFAEVILTNEAQNLTDVSWTLVNVPTKGSVAPMAAGNYVYDFADYTYDSNTGKMVKAATETESAKVYDGFMFNDEPMDFSVPKADSIKTLLSDPMFVYERKHPGSSKATCILLKAKFISNYGTSQQATDANYSYYRIDLMDETLDGYFALYRNYQYRVKIHKVGNRGAATPNEAMNRDSGGNVSMSTEAKKLTDISDGTSRLVVEYVEKNFTSGGKKGLWVQYVPDVTKDEDHDGKADVDNSSIKVTIKDKGNALKEGENGDVISIISGSTNNGYYFYEFELNDQDENEDLVSILQVKADNGVTGDDKSTLYRDVTLRVMKKMNMTLSLQPKKVSGIDTTVLSIALPDSLPSSMFPLELYIEDVNHTLSPTQKDADGNDIDVPVVTAKSLADGTSNSFYFVRTVLEEEYGAWKTDHTITTQFATNQTASATTIYVANEYFKTQTINLLNDGMFVNPTNSTVAFNVTSMIVEVEFDDDNQDKTWTVGNFSTGVSVSYTDAEGITLVDDDDNPLTNGTGNGYFKLTFPENHSTTSNADRTALVSSGSDSQTVTITQTPLKFSISPDTQEVAFNTTTAQVTIYAPEGKAWSAIVIGPTGTNPSLSSYSGEGPTTLTVTIPANSPSNTNNQRSFTVRATMSNPEISVDATIVQHRGPSPFSTFNPDNLTYSFNARTGSGTSGDGFITISMSNIQNLEDGWWSDTTPATDGYFQMGYRTNGGWGQQAQIYRGSISITPDAGVKITQIKVTYTNATNAGYDFSTSGERVTVIPGTYTRDGNSNTATWTGSSTSVITFTNGYSINYNTYYWPSISSIEVEYSPIN